MGMKMSTALYLIATAMLLLGFLLMIPAVAELAERLGR